MLEEFYRFDGDCCDGNVDRLSIFPMDFKKFQFLIKKINKISHHKNALKRFVSIEFREGFNDY